jgi:hypothetical protein
VANDLNAKWSGGMTKFYYINEHCNYTDVAKWLETRGISQTSEGLHDDFAITAQMAAVDPTSRRAAELKDARSNNFYLSVAGAVCTRRQPLAALLSAWRQGTGPKAERPGAVFATAWRRETASAG